MQTATLKDLTTPGLAQLGLLFEVIADIRRLDRPGTNNEAFRSAVRSAIAERLPPLPGPLDYLPRLAPGSTAADAAGMIASIMLRNAGPATALLSRLAGAPIAVEVTRAAHRKLSDGEAALFDARADVRAYEREGLMTAGEVTVAATRLVLIPERLPGVAWGAIQEGCPAGEALGPVRDAPHRPARMPVPRQTPQSTRALCWCSETGDRAGPRRHITQRTLPPCCSRGLTIRRYSCGPGSSRMACSSRLPSTTAVSTATVTSATRTSGSTTTTPNTPGGMNDRNMRARLLPRRDLGVASGI